MNIKVKKGEVFGSVFVVVFNNDGTFEPRVFTDREMAFTFAECLGDMEYIIFEETINRGINEYCNYFDKIENNDIQRIVDEVNKNLRRLDMRLN